MGLPGRVRARFAGLWRAFREHPHLLVVAGVSVALGGAAGWPVGEAGFDYTWRDADFCDDCHIHDYANEAWTRSVHAGLTTCHDCHRVPIRHYPRNLYLAIFDRPEGPEEMHPPEVQNVICEQCHSSALLHEPLTGPMPEALREQVVKVEDSPLHRVHLEADHRKPEGEESDGKGGDAILCMDCHGSESNRAHRFESTTENCVACHETRHQMRGRLELLPCRDCHFRGFVAARSG